MDTIGLVFPHQLFERFPFPQKISKVFMVEESLFFKQNAFHKQKITWQRASMKFYEEYLLQKGAKVIYIEAHNHLSDIRNLASDLGDSGIKHLSYIDPVDDWLERRLISASLKAGISLEKISSPSFLNHEQTLKPFFQPGKSQYNQTSFYIAERKKRKILLDHDNKPVGGKWTYDDENRQSYPRGEKPPETELPPPNEFYREALIYVEKHFTHNPGFLTKEPLYPCTFVDARKWLQNFLETRFHDFGLYEDAIVASEGILNHSVLSPLLNSGLLTPDEVLQKAITYASEYGIPVNSLEGFIRQIIGWREFIQGVYRFRGRQQRTENFWGFTRKIPARFYDGTTGIAPVDITILKILKTGYCHHIERLMVLGNFMLLCEFDPDEVYRWFMELFIDAYDWVMVPNVYGMSQFADGGLMASKPYISGSNYLKKMSDYPSGNWQPIWDALFWRFMNTHRDYFLQNPRLGMLVRTFDKMPGEKQQKHLETAEEFLKLLD